MLIELLDGSAVSYPDCIQWEHRVWFSPKQTGVVSEYGRYAILSYLYSNAHLTPAIGGWDWRLMVPEKGPYTGSLATRLAKYQVVNQKSKLTASEKSEIGNIADRYALPEGATYVLEFSRVLAWRRGEFGDGKSCFFGGEYDHARYILGNAGGCALKFYTDEGKGYARCWILPVRVQGHWGYVLFNAYHDTKRVNRQLRLAHIAQIVSDYFGDGFCYKEACLSDETGDALYINSYNYVNGERDGGDPSQQYIVLPKTVLAPKHLSVILNYESLHMATWREFASTCGWSENVRAPECYACHETIAGEPFSVEGNAICASCYLETTSECGLCRVRIFDSRSVFGTGYNGESLRFCHACCNSASLEPYRCISCDRCDLSEPPLALTNLGRICQSCLDRRAIVVCATCGQHAFRFDTVSRTREGGVVYVHYACRERAYSTPSQESETISLPPEPYVPDDVVHFALRPSMDWVHTLAPNTEAIDQINGFIRGGDTSLGYQDDNQGVDE